MRPIPTSNHETNPNIKLNSERASFELVGVVGRIILEPHDRCVGRAVVVEVHLPREATSMMTPWFVLFEDASRLEGLRVGDRARFCGRLVRSEASDAVADAPTRGLPAGKQPFLKAMSYFLWGAVWQKI